jgi:N-acetylmuramoyl-L-alanine amidase
MTMGSKLRIALLIAVSVVLVYVAMADEFITPLAGVTVCLDPGFGGDVDLTYTGDKIGPKYGLKESEVNLNVSLFLKRFLEKAGAKVVMTRTGPPQEALAIDRRTSVALQNNAQYFICVAHNYSKNPDINYTAVYYYPEFSEPSFSMAKAVSAAVAKQLELQNLGAQVQEYPLLLAEQRVPTIMVCPSFISNPAEEERLKDLAYNRKEAAAIMTGLADYFMANPPIPPVAPERTPGPIISPVPVTTPAAPPTLRPAIAPPGAITPSSPFSPPFLSPVNGRIDQSWIYGESYGDLPVKKGVSFIVEANSPVSAVADGRVIVADTSSTVSLGMPYKNCVIIQHDAMLSGQPVYTLYGQLMDVSVSAGEHVSQGQQIGTTGIPFTTAELGRETEFEFEVRLGENNQANVVNPEPFIRHTSTGTGMIIGRLADASGHPLPLIRIDGAKKPDDYLHYEFSMTYGEGANSSPQWEENFVIGDVIAGSYTLTTQYGTKEVVVEPGMVTYVKWGIE